MTDPEERYVVDSIMPDGYSGKMAPRHEFRIPTPPPLNYKIVPLYWPAVKLTRWQRFKLWLRRLG